MPNPHARALTRSASPSVGLLIHEVSNPFFSEIASGVLAAAERHDRMVMICNTRRDPEQELRYVSEMKALRLHAILVAGSEFVDEEVKGRLDAELESYRRAGGRVVLMRPHPTGTVIIPDSRRGSRLVADHFLNLGHRRIAVIAGPSQLASIKERMTAFVDHLASRGISPVAVVEEDFSRDGGQRAAVDILSRHSDCTALFAVNDLMALGAVRAARHMGLVVPDQVSIAGFNDLPSAVDAYPPLTTVRLPLREMGERALELVLGDEPAERPPLVLDVELIIRGSTGSAPG